MKFTTLQFLLCFLEFYYKANALHEPVTNHDLTQADSVNTTLSPELTKLRHKSKRKLYIKQRKNWLYNKTIKKLKNLVISSKNQTHNETDDSKNPNVKLKSLSIWKSPFYFLPEVYSWGTWSDWGACNCKTKTHIRKRICYLRNVKTSYKNCGRWSLSIQQKYCKDCTKTVSAVCGVPENSFSTFLKSPRLRISNGYKAESGSFPWQASWQRETCQKNQNEILHKMVH